MAVKSRGRHGKLQLTNIDKNDNINDTLLLGRLNMTEQRAAQAEEQNWIWTDGRDLPLEGRAYALPDEAETPYDRLPKARKDVIPPAVWDLQQHTGGMIDVIADAEASVYVLDTFGNMQPDTIVERYEDFVRGLRARRPGVPIVQTANGWIFNARSREKAALIRGIWQKLRAEDPAEWANLHFTGDYDGPLAVADATVEGVHLNDIGSVRAGRVFAEAIREAMA